MLVSDRPPVPSLKTDRTSLATRGCERKKEKKKARMLNFAETDMNNSDSLSLLSPPPLSAQNVGNRNFSYPAQRVHVGTRKLLTSVRSRIMYPALESRERS